MAPIITLLTDFGLTDGYTAAMKGVILGICPRARLVDITHLIPPHDIRAAAFVLSTVYADFPPGTIHLAVVDPGVGSGRRAVVIEIANYYFVGPDNGIFSLILGQHRSYVAHTLENSVYWRPFVSSTFHGRDIFAPVAAHLANKTPLASFGPPCSPLITDWAYVRKSGRKIEGEVIAIDRFGNVITNIPSSILNEVLPTKQWEIVVGTHRVTSFVKTYAEAESGVPVALIGSSGYLEIAIKEQNAANILDVGRGTPVTFNIAGE